MSSRSDRDILDYFEDTSHDEDGTLFIPAPSSRPDSWTFFYLGILAGIFGGALVTLAPWLAGVLIAGGNFTAGLTLKGPGTCFSRVLRFGLFGAAAFGAVMIAGEFFFPKLNWQAISLASERHLIFPTVAVMPWALACLRLIYGLIRAVTRRK